MTDPKVLGVGAMPDVCAIPDGWLAVYRILGGPLIVVATDYDGNKLASDEIPIGNVEGSLFPRLAVYQTMPFLAYPAWREGSWRAVVRWCMASLDMGPERILGRTLGNCPVCLSSDGWFAWQDADSLTVQGVQLQSGNQHVLRGEVRPTGLATCDGGLIKFIDDVRFSVPEMTNPVTAGLCTVGENGTGGVRVRMFDGRQTVLLSGDTFVPRVADGGGSRYALVTWGPAGVQLQPFLGAEITPIDTPPQFPVPPEPPPQPPAPAPPTPAPTPTPVPPPKEPEPMKSLEQMRSDQNELVRFYMEPDGLNRRARGQSEPVEYHDPGIQDWMVHLARGVSIEDVKNQIKQFPEYQEQHRGEP